MSAEAVGAGSAPAPRFTFDTNILIYAHDADAGRRHEIAAALIERALGQHNCVITLQTLAETFHVLRRRGVVAVEEAAALVRTYRDAFPVVAADETTFLDAVDAVRDHQWAFWDAMIWATARRAGCEMIVSEDGQDGRRLLGVTVVNPFAERPSPLLDAIFA